MFLDRICMIHPFFLDRICMNHPFCWIEYESCISGIHQLVLTHGSQTHELVYVHLNYISTIQHSKSSIIYIYYTNLATYPSFLPHIAQTCQLTWETTELMTLRMRCGAEKHNLDLQIPQYNIAKLTKIGYNWLLLYMHLP